MKCKIEELILLIISFMLIVLMGVIFGNNDEFRKNLRDSVQKARESVWETIELYKKEANNEKQ